MTSRLKWIKALSIIVTKHYNNVMQGFHGITASSTSIEITNNKYIHDV